MNRISSIGDFYNYTGRRKYVSFDLFDTLIRRRLLKVNEVHDTVSAYALTQIGKRRTDSPFDVTLLRYRMTEVLKTSNDSGNQEPLIDAVWDFMFRRDVPDAVERARIVERVVTFELELELSNLSLVSGVTELLTKLKNEGRIIIGISDMYFNIECMKTVLRTLDIFKFFDHLYVSAEVGLTKQTGDLFRHVLADLNVRPAQFVHVGDNLRSDVQRATEAGIMSVLVDQPHLLQLERPAYGRREHIEEEVADLIKMHLFSLLLDGQERGLDHIYFMARDGCAIGAFLADWKSSLIERFMPAPECSDLYLNRILSCWGGIDFSEEWLDQAVNLALWLHHDAATPDELCAMLGVKEVPSALGNVPLHAGRDTSRIVSAFVEANATDAIKAAIIGKRAELVRYLDETGFFEHRTVAFSDVGYSGTVLRDLNNLFLNRAAEESTLHPPAMLLSLIATSDNLLENRTRAFPFVEFPSQPILPAEKLPQELKASFAWLEFFFKHPTLLPILRFSVHEGRIAPDLRHLTASSEAVPSQRVARYALSRDEDIVLLWMTALNFTGQIVDPIIDRFANPDPETISQMQDEIFEQHSVRGTRRSIFLAMPGARIEAITIAAQKGDYWIPGSIAVSGAASADAEERAPISRRRFRRWFRPSEARQGPVAVNPPDNFDPIFYREFYSDLRQFTTVDELSRHYVTHGRMEKRLPTRAALIAQLEAEFQTIPADFDGRAYLRMNADLGAQLDTPVQALNHYMRFGRHEGRKYLTYDADLPDAFERLRAAGSIVLNETEKILWTKGVDTLTLFLSRHDVRVGSWLNDLNVAEFKALNYQWCGAVDSTAACVIALLEKGMERSPALSLRTPFDAEYYRSQLGHVEYMEGAELYRHYLNHGSREGYQPSEHAALNEIWGSSDFPRCFDWERYRACFPKLLAAPRAEVLAAFVDDPDPKRLRFIDKDDATAFVEFLAVRVWRRHGRTDEAELLFKVALDAGGGVGRIRHLLGDMALQSGQSGQALVHYRIGAAAPDADLWSSFHAARLLIEQGDYRSALIVLSESSAVWQERAPWRRLWDAAMQLKCTAVLRPLLEPSNNLSMLDAADTFMAEIVARLPKVRPATDAGAGILIVTSRPIDAASPRSSASGMTVINLGTDGGGDFVEALLSHRTVIFHETRFSHSSLRFVALAQSLGKSTIAWLGDLANWNECELDACLTGDTSRRSAMHLHDFPAFALLARYCDSIVTTIAGCVPLLQQLAPQRFLELMARARGSRHGAEHTKNIVAVVSQYSADHHEANMAANAILAAADEDARRFFLIDDSIARLPALRNIPGRWAIVEGNPSLTDLAQLIATVDSVVYVSDDRRAGYSVTAEAAFHNVPVTAVHVSKSEYIALPRGALPETLSTVVSTHTDEGAVSIISNGWAMPLPRPERQPDDSTRYRVRPSGSKARKRILFANVFFAPQVIGGATRVLKDNIDYLLDHHDDEIEIAIFTGDEQNDHSDEWRIDAYRGIPVYRVATPQELNMDWRAENLAVGARFRALLASFKPDLVHIHCLQRLSVTVAEACKAGNVPYIVTLHDAWWISDFPFLSDESGMPVVARPDYYNQERLRGVGIAQSVLRAERLRTALMGAERRLSVSEAFAKIYRAAGIPCETIENGVSRIETVPRSPPTERVELCHVGGLQYHKGAYLIEAVLLNNDYKNLHFTAIDLARGPNQQVRTVWGTTPVTLVGKMSTPELARFYAKMNVLLAPSTWPESYGLVSREALWHGLWVVASDGGGAMADPVIDGVNGFVISTDDLEDLARVLSMIDQNAATYRLPPPRSPKARSADDQSRDLLSLYRSMFTAHDEVFELS